MISEPRDTRISIDHDPESEVYRTDFDGTKISPSIATVEVLARVYDREPVDIRPIADVIDPEALDTICTPKNGRCREGDRIVEFPYQDHTVRVKSYGIIEVEQTS